MKAKVWKIVTISVLGLIDAYFLYSTIGYLVLGAKAPKIIGATNTNFMGMYLMSITYAVLFLVCSVVLVILCIKFFKPKKVKNEK